MIVLHGPIEPDAIRALAAKYIAALPSRKVPENIWKAIKAPTVMVWSNTLCAPTTITTMGNSLPRNSVIALRRRHSAA